MVAANVGAATDRTTLLGGIADAVPHLVWVATPDGVVREYSRRIDAYAVTRLETDDGWRWEAMVHPDDLAGAAAAWTAALAAGTEYEHEHRLRMADGSWRWHLSRGIAMPDPAGSGTLWYGTATDIHAVRDAEERLRAREERLRIAAEVAKFGLYDFDLTSGATYWSPELRDILGVEATFEPPLVGSFTHPDDHDETMGLLAASQAPEGSGLIDHEFRIVRGDGVVRWISVHGRTFFSAPDPGPDRRAVRSVGVVVDITERRQADDLRDVFVSMLSHELRTPVTAIYGGSQVLRREHLDEATRQEIIGDIISESERLERLVENLLVLARAERHAVVAGGDPVLLRPIIARVAADKRQRWPGSVLEVEVEPGLPPVTGDDASVELVLRNLISNALKYGPFGSTVTIAATRSGDGVEVRVSDEGDGIDESQVARLFDLFYRTDVARRRAPGAGIGLFVVRALVEAAGGRVWATNRPTGGAEFGFGLPLFVEADDGPAID